MATPLWANFDVQNMAARLLTQVNVLHTLHLFSNVFTPTPSSVLASFTECAFGGYAPIVLAGQWSGPSFVQDGQYEIFTPLFTFTCTGSPSDQIAGWYIARGSFLAACEAFATAIAMTPGGVFTIQLRPQVISQSIL